MGVSVSGSVSGIKDVTIATSRKGGPNLLKGHLFQAVQ